MVRKPYRKLPGIFVVGKRATAPSTGGDTGEKDFKKKKSKSLQDGLVHNYTYYTYGLLVVFLLCRGGGWFFSGSFINDWITFLLRCPNPKKPHGDVIEMDPKHLTPKKRSCSVTGSCSNILITAL